VLVAAVEKLKRAWSDSGGISAAIATVITKDGDRFTVASTGGEPMNAPMDLNPGDVARFTGRLTLPIVTMPTIKLSLVALIEGSGRVETWREQWFFVSTDRLSPDFLRRVAGLKLKGECAACDRLIGTADRVAMVLLREGAACFVCSDCGALPRDELAEKLEVVGGVESDPALFVAQGKAGECAIALCCGLDPAPALDWNTDGEWDYGLRPRFGLVKKEPPAPDRRHRPGRAWRRRPHCEGARHGSA
jgi:hypothetical protein